MIWATRTDGAPWSCSESHFVKKKQQERLFMLREEKQAAILVNQGTGGRAVVVSDVLGTSRESPSIRHWKVKYPVGSPPALWCFPKLPKQTYWGRNAVTEFQRIPFLILAWNTFTLRGMKENGLATLAQPRKNPASLVQWQHKLVLPQLCKGTSQSWKFQQWKFQTISKSKSQ